MAKESSRTNGGTSGTDEAKEAAVGVMGSAQEAAGKVRMTAERAAERLPEAVAGAHVAARDTQRLLDEMPNQTLVVGTSFSLGLAVGLFLTGFNRLLVLLALAPAAAMAATLLARESETPPSTARGNTSRAAGG